MKDGCEREPNERKTNTIGVLCDIAVVFYDRPMHHNRNHRRPNTHYP